MELRKEALDKRPIKAKIYSGEEFIQEVFSKFKGDQKELRKGAHGEEDDEFITQEENYDLYFPSSDTF